MYRHFDTIGTLTDNEWSIFHTLLHFLIIIYQTIKIGMSEIWNLCHYDWSFDYPVVWNIFKLKEYRPLIFLISNVWTMFWKLFNCCTKVHITNLCYWCLYLAPDASPQDVTAIDITAISINVCYNPPPDSHQNGIITHFNVSYFGFPFQVETMFQIMTIIPTAYPLNRTLCIYLTNLEEYNEYSITVLAINSEGSGPVSQSILVVTGETGEQILILWKNASVLWKNASHHRMMTKSLFVVSSSDDG